jgi:tRNA G10  N-methylase Trm11
MVYKYFSKNNFEDLSSGKILFHKSKYTNYPVRLAGEIFSQCLEHTNKINNLIVYDPCCGSGYLLTILGLLFNEKIEKIFASDISEEAINLTISNLSLLSICGLEKRKNDIMELKNKFNKESHIKALDSIKNICQLMKHDIKTEIFVADILKENELENRHFCADIVITDVPYGNLVSWNNKTDDPMDNLLNTIFSIINRETIIAISHDKYQKINNEKYNRIKKYKIGHRIIEIMKLK